MPKINESNYRKKLERILPDHFRGIPPESLAKLDSFPLVKSKFREIAKIAEFAYGKNIINPVDYLPRRDYNLLYWFYQVFEDTFMVCRFAWAKIKIFCHRKKINLPFSSPEYLAKEIIKQTAVNTVLAMELKIIPNNRQSLLIAKEWNKIKTKSYSHIKDYFLVLNAWGIVLCKACEWAVSQKSCSVGIKEKWKRYCDSEENLNQELLKMMKFQCKSV